MPPTPDPRTVLLLEQGRMAEAAQICAEDLGLHEKLVHTH